MGRLCKRLISLALCACAAAACLTGALARGTAGTLRVGYIDYDGFIQPRSDGTYEGYGVEYLETIAAHTGWDYEFVYDSWTNQLERLRTGDIDLLCQVQKTPQREARYLFSEYSLGSEAGILYALNNDRCYYNDFEGFDGMSVGFLADSFQNAAFADFAEEKGFAYMSRYYATQTEAFDALSRGEVDTVAMGSLAARNGYKILCRFGSDPFYLMTGLQNEDLMAQLNGAMAEIMGSNPYYGLELYREYYGGADAAGSINLTREEAGYIQSCGVISVGQLRNRYPLSNYDEASGELSGINEDILDQISELSGLRFESQPLDLNAKTVDAVKQGSFRLVMGVLQSQQFQRDPELSLTDPFLESTLAVVTRRGMRYDPSASYKVAMKTAFIALQDYLRVHYPQCEMQFYTSDDECLEAVLNGEADIMMQNVYVTNYLLQRPAYGELEILPTTFMMERSCIMMGGGEDPLLRSILNKSITALKEADLNRIILANTTARPYRLTSRDVFDKYRSQIVLLGTLAVLCMGLLAAVLVTRQREFAGYAGEKRPAGGGGLSGGAGQRGQEPVFGPDEP